MQNHISRRNLLGGIFLLAASTGARAANPVNPFYGGGDFIGDPKLLPPPESPIDYPILRQSNLVPAKFRRQEVAYETSAPPNSIVVDPGNRFLYYVLGNQRAIRYGVGVGRQGFAWSGKAVVGMKRKWPRWLPPQSMVERDARAATWANGMPGGPQNPLGARALYLFANGVDTLYRIHGTNEPGSIGKAVSSGCIRMLNEDVVDLYEKVPRGTKVVVLPASNS